MYHDSHDDRFSYEEQQLADAPMVELAERARPSIEFVEKVTTDAKGRKHVPIQWRRRLFHMSSVVYPLAILALGIESNTVLKYFWPFVALLVVPEFFRFRLPKFNDWYISKFGGLMRPHEKDSMHTAALFALTVYGGVTIFGLEPMIAAFLCLSLGDPIAAIVGLKFGRIRVLGKTLEGSLACFVACFGVCLWAYPGNLVLAGLAALAATLGELLPLPVNDNVRIPVLTAATITVVSALQANPGLLGF